jgi:phage FluMu gp28-like protein
MGVDLARLKDFSVLTVLDRNSRHLVHFDRFNQISWEVQYQRIIATAKRYHALVVMDSTGIGDPIVQTIQGAGVKVVPYKIGSSAAKQQLIDKLRVGIENERVSFPHIPVLKRELESYEYSVSESGTVKFSAPSGQHDDTVIATALAYYAVDKAPFVYKYSNQRGV